jgi:putative phosphoesterase
MTTLGVIADTHIPDRVPVLNPQVLEIFQQAQVTGILHAGDVIMPQVLEELGKVAPVKAVRGNRDIFYLRNLPLRLVLTVDGFTIGMAHGHGTFGRYMIDKFRPLMPVELQKRHTGRMLATFPDVDIIVFGHLHFPCNLHLEGKLFFNPGSASFPILQGRPATVGLLHIDQAQGIQGEIVALHERGGGQ